MNRIGSMFFRKLLEYKLLLFSLLLVGSYTYIIRSDYVAADAYVMPSDDYAVILQDNPLETEITASGKKINSILFSIQNPEISSEGTTSIELYDENEMIGCAELYHNNYYETTDTLGNAVELPLNEGGG